MNMSSEAAMASAMAAAISAAAEIAKNSKIYLGNGNMVGTTTTTTKKPPKKESHMLHPTLSHNEHPCEGNQEEYAPPMMTMESQQQPQQYQPQQQQQQQVFDNGLLNDALSLSNLRSPSHSSSSLSSLAALSPGQQQQQQDDDDAEKRLARSRERNREHARKTRLRKKAQLEALQDKVKELEVENRTLKQSVEDCSIASILLGLSTSSSSTSTKDESNNNSSSNGLHDVEQISQEVSMSSSSSSTASTTTAAMLIKTTGKRKRFITEESWEAGGETNQKQSLTLNIDGHLTEIGGGKSHINWKSGLYCDKNGVQQQLTQEQLETLRRERNRMHAKMTRDRKKGFISAIKNTIIKLETENKRMRDALSKVAELQGNDENKNDGANTTISAASMTPPSNSPVLAALTAAAATASGAVTPPIINDPINKESHTPSLQDDTMSHPTVPEDEHLLKKCKMKITNHKHQVIG